MTLGAIIVCRIGAGHICQNRSERSIGNLDAGGSETHGISGQHGSADGTGQHGADGLNGFAKNGAHGVVAQYVAGGTGTVIGHRQATVHCGDGNEHIGLYAVLQHRHIVLGAGGRKLAGNGVDRVQCLAIGH